MKKSNVIVSYKKILIIIIILGSFFIMTLLKINFSIEIKNKVFMEKSKFFDKNFDYLHYENDIITEKMKKNANWILAESHIYLINGLIRKYKPKNCLEIGVARGGSSILILNAIKDYPDSQLISIDLFTNRGKNKIGYLVERHFPELMNKWKLFLGEMPHRFLTKLNIKFDFLFLDSAHMSPGEFFNFIEALPFLNENAIVVIHDIVWHYLKAMIPNQTLYDAKVMPTQIYLMSSLMGEKIIMKRGSKGLDNIGVVCLSSNQKNYYLNYFLLIMTIWQYMPTEKQLNDLREFISNYYKNKFFLKIFDYSVYYNKKFFYNLKTRKYINAI